MVKKQNTVNIAYYDVVVVGAGPYGLSCAAHLQERGLQVAIFGRPLNLWREHMPQGMLLRSFWWASNLSDSSHRYGLEQYFQEQNLQGVDPFPMETFIDYGLWFQKHAVPNVDETYVKTIEQRERQFTLTLADGRMLQSRAVVMAPGLHYYCYCPTEYSHLPAELVSHTSNHASLDRFAGKKVVVIGGGQSALETAALLMESGAQVQIVSRSPLIWIPGDVMAERNLIKRIRAPKAGISPDWFSWTIEHFPYAFQGLPRSTKDRLLRGRGRYGPLGACWLKPRIEGKAIIHEQLRVQKIKETDDSMALTLSNGKILKADHVILGTGYQVDIKRLPMLRTSLLSTIETYHGAPVLNHRFESSVSGLYFVGFSSVSSFGPLYRFVLGTQAAARRVASSVARQAAHTKRVM